MPEHFVMPELVGQNYESFAYETCRGIIESQILGLPCGAQSLLARGYKVLQREGFDETESKRILGIGKALYDDVRLDLLELDLGGLDD